MINSVYHLLGDIAEKLHALRTNSTKNVPKRDPCSRCPLRKKSLLDQIYSLAMYALLIAFVVAQLTMAGVLAWNILAVSAMRWLDVGQVTNLITLWAGSFAVMLPLHSLHRNSGHK